MRKVSINVEESCCFIGNMDYSRCGKVSFVNMLLKVGIAKEVGVAVQIVFKVCANDKLVIAWFLGNINKYFTRFSYIAVFSLA